MRFPGDGARDGGHVENGSRIGEGGDGLERVLRDAEQRGGSCVDARIDHAVIDVPHDRTGADAAQLGVADLMIGQKEQKMQIAFLVGHQQLVRLDFVPRDRIFQRNGQTRHDGTEDTTGYRGNWRLLAEKHLRVRTDQKRARGVHGDQRVRRVGDGELRKPRGYVDYLATGNIEGIDADLEATSEFVENCESDGTIVRGKELEITNAKFVDVHVERMERDV